MSAIDPSLLSSVRYRCIGPTRGGRVVAVAADPTDPAVFYFGACAGGVWKSDDSGQYWENVSDGFFATSSVGALAVAPSDPNVIYAGMGEATIRIDVSHGDGVYKSTDAGKNWAHMGLPESRHIGEIVVHPTDPDVVYVAALGHASKDNPERGLYRSIDGGRSWELVLHVSERAGAIDVTVDPNNPRVLFATMWQARRTFWSIDSGGPDSGLWRSLDGGDTWENISTNTGLPDGTLGKIGVSISPARSGRVFAIVEAEGTERGLYRSDDAGDSWIKVSSKAELCWRPWYYMHVIAHPTDADTVYVMNMKAWKSIDGGKEFEELLTPHGDNHALWIDPANPDRMIGCDDGGAWVSFNDGRSWSTIYNQPTAQIYHVATDDQYPYLVYGTQQDNSSIAVPSQNGKGAITWGDCYAPGTGESGYIAPKPDDPDIVYVGAIGSSAGSGDALQRFDRRTGQLQLVNVWPEEAHDGNTAEVRFQWTYPIMFAPHDTSVLYATGNKVFRSTDEGHSWETISPDLTYADPETLGVSGPLTMDSAGAEMYGTIFSFLPSAHVEGTLLTGSDDGLVHRTTDGGSNWTNITPPDVPKFSQVTMLAESPSRPGTVFMTIARHKMGDYAPHVFKTTDFGDTWARITDGLPEDDFCRVIREDPGRTGLLYLGTEQGLFVSFDDGEHWQSLQANLPVTPVYDLIVKGTDLVVATHGRSFWILDDLTQIHQLHDGLSESDVHLFTPPDVVRTPPDLFADFLAGSPGGKNYHVSLGQNATFYLDEDETGHKIRRVIDAGEDLPRGVKISYLLSEDASAATREEGAPESTLTVYDPAGVEVMAYSSTTPENGERHGLSITTKAGMNTFRWPMTWPAGEKMVDTDFHGRPAAPLAMPGRYSVELSIANQTITRSFELLLDPRVEVAQADLDEQLQFLLRIRDKLSELVIGVNRIRHFKNEAALLQDRLTAGGATEASADLQTLVEKFTAVEHELVQHEFRSEGDTLNHRQMLFEKLSGLVPVIASADARPTKQSYAVYEKLVAQVDTQLEILDTLLTSELVAVNDRLADVNVGVVGV